MKRAHHNVSQLGKNCTLLQCNSNVALFKMANRKGYAGFGRNSVDIAMIDGAHHDLLAWSDARMVLPLMKPGGWMLFDDVENDQSKGDRHVKAGIECFLKEHGSDVEFLWKHRYMECYRRK